jgi:flagellar capping protein FliD
MAAFNKFNLTVEDWLKGLTNYSSDTFKVMLTSGAPVATNHVIADLTDLASGGGYTSGGQAITISSVSNSSGLETVVAAASNPTWTGSGTGFGTFRYVVVYDSSAATKTLQAWFDYGSAISVNSGDTFTITFGANFFTLQ